MTIGFTNKLRTKPLSPRRGSLWQTIAEDALGKDYDLSVVFCGDAFMRRINRQYRQKDMPTNVLAFPLSDDAGEIYLDMPYVKRESKKYDHPASIHLDYLFIHGLLHLAGYDHGDAMEREERRLLKKHVA